MGFQANEAIYQLTNSDLDVYGRASVNSGAKGGVVLALIASSAAKVEIVPEAGGEIPATTTHTQFVSDRNKVYNSIQTQKTGPTPLRAPSWASRPSWDSRGPRPSGSRGLRLRCPHSAV